MDKDEFTDTVVAGEPLIAQSMQALKRYWEARDYGAPAEEVERLRLHSESLAQAVSDYQLRTVAKARSKDLRPLHKDAGLHKTDSLEVNVRALMAERQQRTGYEKQLEAALGPAADYTMGRFPRLSLRVRFASVVK